MKHMTPWLAVFGIAACLLAINVTAAEPSTKAELQGFYRASTAIMDPYSTTDLSLEVFGYRRNGMAESLRTA